MRWINYATYWAQGQEELHCSRKNQRFITPKSTAHVKTLMFCFHTVMRVDFSLRLNILNRILCFVIVFM